MPRFKFKARDKSGKEINDTRDANDKYELARILKNSGILLLSAEEVVPGSSPRIQTLAESLTFLRALTRVKLAEKIIFSKNLGVMIGAGLSLTRALEALGHETHNMKFRAIIEDVIEQVRQGKAFHESLSGHPKVFPQIYLSMVEAGEKSGKLQESLTLLATQMQADYDLLRKVRGAMIYPGVIMVAMVLIGILMLIYVVPTLTAVFKELDVELPITTQVIIYLSDFFLNYILLVLVGFVMFAFGVFQLMRTKIGKYMLDIFFIKAPIVGPLAKKFNAARTARTLSSLLSAGVQILEAIDITSRVVQNHFYSEVLAEARADVQKGETISKVFLLHANLYPSLMGEMLAVGEETGESSKMLNEVATFYEQQVSDATRDLSTVIEPVLMIFIGAVVGFFAVSMISPMYTLTGKI
jgi:type IV pilus assembly protein PilC